MELELSLVSPMALNRKGKLDFGMKLGLALNSRLESNIPYVYSRVNLRVHLAEENPTRNYLCDWGYPVIVSLEPFDQDGSVCECHFYVYNTDSDHFLWTWNDGIQGNMEEIVDVMVAHIITLLCE